jgi:hypothetical protein
MESGGQTGVRIFDCVLIVIGFTYLMIEVGLKGFENATYENYWMLGTLGGVFFCQMLYVIFRRVSFSVSMFQGFITVPLCMVSCVMGALNLITFEDVPSYSIERLTFLGFLGINFFYLAISSMVYINKAVSK